MMIEGVGTVAEGIITVEEREEEGKIDEGREAVGAGKRLGATDASFTRVATYTIKNKTIIQMHINLDIMVFKNSKLIK
jgi:hypothetical protein